jgi:hypothetical protein
LFAKYHRVNVISVTPIRKVEVCSPLPGIPKSEKLWKPKVWTDAIHNADVKRQSCHSAPTIHEHIWCPLIFFLFYLSAFVTLGLIALWKCQKQLKIPLLGNKKEEKKLYLLVPITFLKSEKFWISKHVWLKEIWVRNCGPVPRSLPRVLRNCKYISAEHLTCVCITLLAGNDQDLYIRRNMQHSKII